ncbi:MAG: hypothetical protein NC229_08480 [Bacteroides sp.]|nr:hypothetical protein [Bacteroidales bacterium]MCM1068720.1 hypothetical protein [Prevotella sp.]MCM1354680.1 hypothetical protein [Bacteroides sp.]MCM1403772.1 hypothetical protein [Bacteroides sp.]MCM1443510.1 hypothetical protein [Muribaculum sp.]
MLNFLKGYIGLLSNGAIIAESGLYIDALPDISLQILEDITDNELDSGDTWSRIEDRGLLKFRTLFIAEVNKCHKITNIEICECLIESNREILATALLYLLGAEVMLTRRASSRINMATIDRNKPKELREYFEDQFAKELSTAVASIDIHSSECFSDDTHPEQKQLITFELPIL